MKWLPAYSITLSRIFPLFFLPLLSHASTQPALTIYSGRFAVVRDTLPLDLKAGLNQIRYAEVTSSLEPTSVILRDPSGKLPLSILEQSYRNEPLTETLLLDHAQKHSQTIRFLVRDPQKTDRIVEGKVIRSGHLPGGTHLQPIIELDGQWVFGLPGTPLFPALEDSIRLKPELFWVIQSAEAIRLVADLTYLTPGLEWSASYNLVLAEKGEDSDFVGSATIQNHSGKHFEEARIKLVAGDVHRAQPDSQGQHMAMRVMALGASETPPVATPGAVTEKSLDEFHLYELPRPTSLPDRTTKQVEFYRTSRLSTKRIYRYEGNPGITWVGQPVLEREWGIHGENKRVESWLEFRNSAHDSHPVPLPGGNVRVYRHQGDQLEFVGEDHLGHTPRNETVRLRLGNAFDLAAERRQTDFRSDLAKRVIEESFEIHLRNQGRKAVEIQVLEHLARSSSWSVSTRKNAFRKVDSQTIEFTVPVAAESESVIQYSVRYSW